MQVLRRKKCQALEKDDKTVYNSLRVPDTRRTYDRDILLWAEGLIDENCDRSSVSGVL